MAHFAEIDLNTNEVIRVIVVCDNDVALNGENGSIEMEELMKKRHPNPNTYWKQTSYNTLSGIHKLGGIPFRLNYAGIGKIFNNEINGFIEKKPYNSWILNEDTGIWNATIPYPNDNNQYDWNEETLSWKIVEI